MKKIWKIAVLLLLIANLVAVFASGKTVSHTYPMAVRVDHFDQAEDLVYFVDGGGSLWAYEGIEDWQLGDVAALLMDDNGTENYIYDDQIVAIRYAFNMFPESEAGEIKNFS